MDKLAGKVAIVTGAARGIGRAVAAAFAAEGAAVAFADRDGAGAGSAAEESAAAGARTLGLTVDVTDPAAVEQMIEETVGELGGLHVLVNNAGICSVAPVVEMELEQWQAVIDTDLTSVFLCTKAALRPMVEQRWGRIINIGSQLALKGSATMAHYSAAKSGVHGFTRALAYEVAPYGITVNVIAPGPIETDMLAADPQDWRDAKLAEIPLGRFGRVEDVAPTAVLLASEDGAYYTGSTLNVSGGDVM
jgi:3-oxoacyl-[acyl-carrier protein] reductase